MSDHDRIWLQNADDAKNHSEGRLWCEDKVWPDDDSDGEPTEYVRADILANALSSKDAEIEALRTRAESAEALLAEAGKALKYIAKTWPDSFAARHASTTLFSIGDRT